MLNALANLAIRRSRVVIVTAVLASVVAGALGAGVASRLDPYGDDDPATESVQADNRLDDAGFQDLGLIALVRGVDVSSPQTKQRVRSLASRISEDPAVGRIADYYTTGSRDFVSADGHSTYLAVDLKPHDDKEQQDAAKRIADRMDGAPGVTLGGPALAQEQVNKQVESDLRKAELLAFPFLFLLSLLFFRSGVAALLPPLIGGLAIVGTFLMLRVASELTSVSIFALNLVTGLGLGLAIDYSLFMVSRYREEIARSGPGAEAMRRTMATAGRTIVFSSLTVAAALASLLIFPQRFLYSMGLGGSLVALIAAGLALVVLPAILALLGTRVNSLAPAFLQARAEREARPTESGFWYRLSRFVMRRPGPIAAASATLLIALGIPFFGDQVHRRGRDRAANVGQRPPGGHRDEDRVPAPSGLADPAGHRRRQPGPARQAEPRGPAHPGRRGGRSTAAPRGRSRRDERDLPVRPAQRAQQGRRHRDPGPAGGPRRRPGDWIHGSLHRHAVEPGRPSARGARDRRGHDIPGAVPVHRLGRAAAEGAAHELPHAERRVRDPRPDLPGRPLRGTARLHEPGRDRADDAAAPVRGRVRPLDRLRGLPAFADQGGEGWRRERLRGGRDRARAHGANRHRGGAAVRGRDRGLRHVRDHLHQGERARAWRSRC